MYLPNPDGIVWFPFVKNLPDTKEVQTPRVSTCPEGRLMPRLAFASADNGTDEATAGTSVGLTENTLFN
ncbi:hypothetical protein V6N13_132900 [Hibiscus sabdariffa]